MDNSKHVIEKIFWVLIYICAIIGAVLCCLAQWNRYLANPIVISMDRDYRNWDGVFPGFTLCHVKRFDDAKAMKFIEKKWNINETADKFLHYMKFIETVTELTIENLETMENFVDDQEFENIDFLEIVRNVHPDTEISVLIFDKEKEGYLHEILTEKGLCFSMNSANKALALDNVTGTESSGKLLCSFNKNLCYFKIYIRSSKVKVAIHSPYEIVTEATPFIPVEKTDLIYSTFKILETVVADGVKDLSQEQRKCFFYNEPLEYMDIYSGTNCITNCKAKSALKICGCKPYFYKNYPGKTCTPAGYLCLKNLNYPKNYLHDYFCPQTCTEFTYLRNTMITSQWDKTEDLTVVQKASIRVEIISAKLRIRREVLFSFDDLLVSFGGSAALFLGLSTLDFFKWLYKFLVLVRKFHYKILKWKTKYFVKRK